MLTYPIELTPDDNDTYFVTSPDFPELKSFGETREEAAHYASKALEEAVAARLNHFEEIPRPSQITDAFAKLPMQLTFKLLLKWQLDETGSNRNQLALAMGKARPQIDRLFDPKHGTKLDQFEAAARALGTEFDISLTTISRP